MDEALDIRDVARMTGLTSRALRFYEARGLVHPLRTYNGRRFYGRGDLERINQIVALKRAGLSLSQIAALTSGRTLDLGALIEAQLAALNDKYKELEAARALLLKAKSRIDRGEPVDAATLCSLISNEELTMTKAQWDKVTDRYFTDEQKAEFAERMKDMPPNFDQAAYNAKWADLGARVQAVIPLGPDSPEAQGLVTEWKELLAPFTAVATPGMMQGVSDFYGKMDEWQGDVPGVPFTADVFRFIQEASRSGSAKD
nr:MerR family transcriptional regulator [uncultured Sphingomonas sp.]